MILREATIKYSGNDPDKLSKWSKDRICISCNECGRIRWVRNDAYYDLCPSCSHKNISLKTRQKMSDSAKGKIISKETRLKISKIHLGKKRSEKTKQKMRKPKSEEHKINMSKNHWDCSGKNHPMFGKYQSEETKRKIRNSNKGQKRTLETRINMSCILQGINRDDFNGFIGKHPKKDYILSSELCIKLNTKFKGSEFHHIMSGVGIYVPKYMNHNISHNMKTGKNMKEINNLAMDYLRGEF